MWKSAGASIVSPPSNEIYNAFQSGVINGTDTSLGSFQSMRLYEVTDCLTAPGNNALWFMYEPVLMSKKSFDKLNKKQQEAVIAAGKKAQAFYEGKADEVNEEAVKAFRDHKVKVVIADRRRLPCLARCREEERLCRLRQESAERPEADRRSAGGEVTIAAFAAGWRCPRRPAAKRRCDFSTLTPPN